MPYLKIALNRTLTVAGKKYRHGVHEVDNAVAARVRELKARYSWKHVGVSESEPVNDIEDSPNARAGTLTQEDIDHGTAGAEAKAEADAADAAEAAAARAAAEADVVGSLEEALHPFACEDPDCDATFPSEAALGRHVEMNHGLEEAPAAADDDLEAPAEEGDGDTAPADDDGDNAADTPEEDDNDGDDAPAGEEGEETDAQ